MNTPALGALLAIALVFVSRTPAFFLSYHAYMFVLLVVLPLVFMRFSGKRPSDYYISLGDLKLSLKYSGGILILALPFMYYGAGLASFKEYYPLWEGERESVATFLFYEIFVMGAVMFYTEFFYRGFLLQSLMSETKYGNLIHSLLYMYVHLGKPGLEVLWSLPAGYVFGMVDMRCKSILPGFLMHWISSLIFTAMVLYL